MINAQLQALSDKQKQLQSLLQDKPADFRSQLNDWIRVELTYSSNYIEGNTLTRQQTAEIIEKGTSAIVKSKPLIDQLEALNHASAIDHIQQLSQQLKSHQYITENNIRDIHRIILTSIDNHNAGNYRNSEVFLRGISDVTFPQPNQVPIKMRQLIEWLDKQQGIHPATVAADLHSRFVTIHPFIDGNGRTARLLMNLVLLLNNYPLTIIRAEDRQDYLESLHSLQTKSNSQNYYQLIYQAIKRSLDSYLNLATGKPALTPFGTHDGLLKIGKLATLSNTSISTIRHYINQGLIKPTTRTKANYMLFDPDIANTIHKIKQLQSNNKLSIQKIKTHLKK